MWYNGEQGAYLWKANSSIERLLKIKVARLDHPELQKQINPYYTRKGVRLDVYVADSERVFDLEIQTYRTASIGKRARYYQSMLDIDSLMKGKEGIKGTAKNLLAMGLPISDIAKATALSESEILALK